MSLNTFYSTMIDEKLPRPRPRTSGEMTAKRWDPDRRLTTRTGGGPCSSRSSPRTGSGPIFFEIIQRKGNDGFGNSEAIQGACFESLELDQIRRGVIPGKVAG